MNYCKRWKTREVFVGKVGVGGENPIRIQSMTTSPTHEVNETVEQVIRLADAGCEIVRVTVQGQREAAACGEIKNLLVKKGYDVPLVADIHFYPPAALTVADFVDKVRVNPGNYADRRATFKVIEYDDAAYAAELERIREKFSPLVLKCKKLKRSIRIGTNHGSLSDRILNRYGDTPRGMVESALEYARVCRELDFHDFMFSMKASNTLVMTEAYRKLVDEMISLGWDYPLHLGVTEAGDGEDGRIKSAMGIGSLLLDGIGDTIRVSLTEDPWFEIDPCKRLRDLSEAYPNKRMSIATRFERKLIDRPPVLTERSGEIYPEDEINPLEPIDSAAARYTLSQSHQVIRVTDENWDCLLQLKPELVLLAPSIGNRIAFCRSFQEWRLEKNFDSRVILDFTYDLPYEDFVIQASAEMGSLLCDGIGDGVLIRAPFDTHEFSLALLQAARMRSSKTEFISCPSCGRTLFNLQDVTRRIREKTAHLPGVKIAIMGCIVNGPGEMADAHFGYVGSKAGKIDLYVGKDKVEQGIDFSLADERLIELIKKNGMWKEPVLD